MAGLGLAGGLAISAGRPGLAETPRRGGVLRVVAPPSTDIDPLRMDSAGSIAIVQQAAEYLVWVEPDLSLRPVLATGWGSPDGGASWVFDIRQGVRFHDGRELTADDVVASFRRMVDPGSAPAAAAQLPFLTEAGITKLSEHRVQFVLARPIGQFPYYTNTYNAVILPRDHAGHDWARRPVGTGPFRLTGYRPQQGASFVRNEDYWDKGKPYLDGVEISLLESPQAMAMALQEGRTDVILSASFADSRVLLSNPNVYIVAIPATEHRQLCMRVDRAPFDDRQVRQAVALCLHRSALVRGLLGRRGLFGGFADIGNDHPVAPLFPEEVLIPQREQDLAEARRLLAAAGHPEGFAIDLHTAWYAELPHYAQLIKEMLEPAGIRVTLRIEPLEVYYRHWTEVTFGLTDWTGRPTAIQALAVAFKGGAAWNAARWRSEEFDGLLGRIEAEVDEKERARLLTRAATILHEEVPAVIAYFTNNLRPTGDHVAGVPGSISQYLDLTEAYLA